MPSRLSALALVSVILLSSLSSVVADFNLPPNVIFLLGSGNGFNLTYAAQIVEVGISGNFTFDSWLAADVDTRNANQQLTDTSAAATALATGVSTLNGRLSVTPGGTVVKTLFERLRSKGYRTGLVATTDLGSAPPAAFYAHDLDHTDLAGVHAQLLAADVDVLLGGGSFYFTSSDEISMIARGYTVVTDRSELFSFTPTAGRSRLLGLFASTDFPYEKDRDFLATPSLPEMVGRAIDVMQWDSSTVPFVLVVIAGRIDQALIAQIGVSAVLETIELKLALDTSVQRFSNMNRPSLLVMTSDHETSGIQINPSAVAGVLPDPSQTDLVNRARRMARANSLAYNFTVPGSVTNSPVGLYVNSFFGTSFQSPRFTLCTPRLSPPIPTLHPNTDIFSMIVEWTDCICGLPHGCPDITGLPPPSNLAAVVTGIVLAVVGLIFLCTLAVIYTRRRAEYYRHENDDNDEDEDDFDIAESSSKGKTAPGSQGRKGESVLSRLVNSIGVVSASAAEAIRPRQRGEMGIWPAGIDIPETPLYEIHSDDEDRIAPDHQKILDEEKRYYGAIEQSRGPRGSIRSNASRRGRTWRSAFGKKERPRAAGVPISPPVAVTTSPSSSSNPPITPLVWGRLPEETAPPASPTTLAAPVTAESDIVPLDQGLPSSAMLQRSPSTNPNVGLLPT